MYYSGNCKSFKELCTEYWGQILHVFLIVPLFLLSLFFREGENMAQVIHLAKGSPGTDLICLSAKLISEQKATYLLDLHLVNIW